MALFLLTFGLFCLFFALLGTLGLGLMRAAGMEHDQVYVWFGDADQEMKE